MNNLEKKEKNLDQIINKLSRLSLSYSHNSGELSRFLEEKKQILDAKKSIEKRNDELLRELNFLRERVNKLQTELTLKSEKENKFDKEIDELNQETENLVQEIEKWQM